MANLSTMKRWTTALMATALVALAPLEARAEVEFSVQPEAAQVEEGENVALDFVVTSDAMGARLGDPRFNAPDFDEVNVFQRGTSIQSEYENGHFQVRRSERMTVVLHPKRAGRLTIRGISIIVDGKSHTAPDVTVEVLPAGQHARGGNRGQQSPFPQARPALPQSGLSARGGRGPSLLLRTEPDKVKVYKGEQIHLTYALYARTQVASLEAERFPTATGFLKEDLDIPILKGVGNLDWRRSVINGTEYRKAVLAEYALFPVREGKLPLDVFSAKIAFRSGNGMQNLLDDDDAAFGLNRFFQAFQLMTETQSSDHISVEVLPLPAEGQPADFSGLVGDFEVSATADKATLRAGEPLNVKVRVEGRGHAGSLERLKVSWPQDFEQYEDRSSTKFEATGRSERVFDYLLIPRVKGRFTLPAIEISMFDPQSRGYKIKKAQPIEVDVLEGDGSAQVPRSTGAQGQAQLPSVGPQTSRVGNAVSDWLRAHAPAGGWMGALLAGLGWALFSFAGVVALILGILASWRGWRRARDPRLKERKWRDALARAESMVEQDPVAALAQVDVALGEYLSQKKGFLKGSLLTRDLTVELVKRGIRQDLAQRVQALAELSDNQRFLPPSQARNPAAAHRAIEEFKALVEGLS